MMQSTWVVIAHAIAVAGLVAGSRTTEAQAPSQATDLAKTSQNPVGDLVSIPIQFNHFSGGGLTNGRSLYNINVQPVFPLKINQQWTLIARTIVPYLNIPGPDNERATGLGDIQQQFFLTPAKPGGLIWGAGPILSFPTATNDLATTGAWAAGPTVVLVKMAGPFVLGGLASWLWTFHDEDEAAPEVNTFTIQPFINYNLPDGWSFVTAPIITSNLDAESGEKWTVPLGIGVSKVTAIGTRPVNLSVQYYNNVTRPEPTGRSQLRFVVSLLYPVPK